MSQHFYGTDGKKTSGTVGKVASEAVQPVKEELRPEEERKHSNSDLAENMDGSPIMDGHDKAGCKTENDHNDSQHDSQINEDMIKKAIIKRAPYFRSNLEYVLLQTSNFIHMVNVSCGLEDDNLLAL